MKKIMRKLVLSSFALGLAAVTLTTTTFAWYTSNTDASTNAVQGNTSSASSADTLLISATGLDGSWSNTCTPTINTGVNMLPVQYNGSNYTYVQNVTETGDPTTASATDYLTFNVYFKTIKNEGALDDEVKVYIKSLSIQNTGTLTNFDNLLYNQSIAGAPSGEVYSVDMTRALNLVTTSIEGANPSLDKNHLDLTGLTTPLTETGHSSAMNALSYYNAVMEDDLKTQENNTIADPVSTTTGSGAAIDLGSLICTTASATDGTLAVYSILKVTFVVYLDGWDNYCFDACKGQTFSISLSFTTAEDDVALYNVA